MKNNILLFIALFIFCYTTYLFAQQIESHPFTKEDAQQLINIINEADSLIRPADIPRRIAILKQALGIVQKKVTPDAWAWLHNELAICFDQTQLGDRAENLELAIHHYQLSLQVYTRDDFSYDWARTQSNLAGVYHYRIQGNRAENLEQAIAHYQLALEVYTREVFPEWWAMVQSNLATVYCNRIRGDRAENLEQAINHCQQTCQVFTHEQFPEWWAMNQNNLAMAYSLRIRGDLTENLELAIHHYQLSLQVLTRDDFPWKWAWTQNNLASAYTNDELAIHHYQLALQVYTRDDFPEQWAEVQNNLAMTYYNRIRGDRAENLELAINHCQLALKIYTLEVYPQRWAITQGNLAGVYYNRIRGDRAENLELAIHHYQLTYKILTAESFPRDYRRLSQGKGDALVGINSWESAIQAYSDAIEIGEDLLILAADEETQAKELAEIHNAFRNQAYCLAKLEKPFSALEALEQGKTRLLNQRLLLKNLQSRQLTLEKQQEMNALLKEIQSLEQQLQSSSDYFQTLAYSVIAEELRHRREKLQMLIGTIRQQLGLATNESWDTAALLHHLREQQIALVEVNVTPVGSVVWVSLPGSVDPANDSESGLEILFLDHFTSDSLRQLTWADERNSNSLSWVKIFPQAADRSRWQAGQPQLLRRLGEWFWPRLDSLLQRHQIRRLLLVPQGELFFYPLHAAPFTPLPALPDQPVYPLERYIINYAPSARLYERLSQVSVASPEEPYPMAMSRQALFVEDPDGNLGLALSQQTWLAKKLKDRRFQLTQLSSRDIISNKVLQHSSQATLIHYYGHGYYNWSTPDSSGLKMYSPGSSTELLTLARIRTHASMNQAQLVVLSACETGMTDVANIEAQDQFMGLPASFLQAGARAVIGSLWSVPNVETSLLFSRFYRELLDSKEPLSPAEALQRAQLWLLRAKPEEIIAEGRQINLDAEAYLGLEKETKKLKTGKPENTWTHPENWAGFYIVGDGFTEFR